MALTATQILTSYPVPERAVAHTAMVGRWYVVKTSLPFWRTRTNPTITYTLLDSGVPMRFLDDVQFYTQSGSVGHVVGIDRQNQAYPRLFHWRGKPWYLRWLTSDWCFLDHDPACAEWAVTYFSKTPFTAAGIDIYSRTPTLDPVRITQIENRLIDQPALAAFVPLLVAPKLV